ncbi:MAG: polysaccharide deacetylase family protein [Ignavibacteria bacterium]|nr:polysaccharide deacetylase family protein [Ignavibacteria bacterium]
MCITIDDLPVVVKYYKDTNTYNYITDNILAALKKYGIKAIGAVNEGKMYSGIHLDSNKYNILRKWLGSGMELSNHTFAHSNYNDLSFKEFSKDIIKGETILTKVLGEYGKKLVYFRHPFLFRGNTKEKADSLESFLNHRGYTVTPVTIDNADYEFARAYEKASFEENDSLKKLIGDEYISYMEKVIDYYESQSIKIFGYNVKHILLTHANLLNADNYDRLFEMYQNRGYKFINFEDAMKDECYKTNDEYYKKSGISWLHRWAYTMGKRGDFFAGEPEVPEYIENFIKNNEQ